MPGAPAPGAPSPAAEFADIPGAPGAIGPGDQPVIVGTGSGAPAYGPAVPAGELGSAAVGGRGA